MKTRLKRSVGLAIFLTFFLPFLLSSLAIHNVSAATSIYNPGSPLWDGYVHWTVRFNQLNYHDYADNLEFDITVVEYLANRPTIIGWKITVSDFISIGVDQPNPYLIEIQAFNGYVYYQGAAEVTISLWLSGESRCDNQVRLENMRWSKLTELAVAIPDTAWLVDGGDIRMSNPSSTHGFYIEGFEYLVTRLNYNVTLAPFDTAIPGSYTLLPGTEKIFTVSLGGLTYGHVLFHYRMHNISTGQVISEGWGDHGFGTPRTGGIQIPLNMLDLLAPYVALAVAAVIVTVGAVYARKRWFGKIIVPKP
ncbi:MAG: hypothetical protein ACFFDE_06935 [Promethearchaeota archaeon]